MDLSADLELRLLRAAGAVEALGRETHVSSLDLLTV